MNNLPSNIRLIDMNTPGTVVTTAAINSYTALAVPAYYRAMTFLSQNMASFPRSVRKVSGDTSTAVTHALDELMTLQPNAVQDAFTFWQALYFHCAHYSNGYAEIVRDDSGGPDELRNLTPEDVYPIQFDRDDGLGLRRYYAVGADRILPATDVIHLSRLSYDGIAGMNTVHLHGGILRRAGLMNAYVTKFLERGSVIRGSIEFPAETTMEKIEEVVDLVRRFYSGVDADRDLLTLGGGAKLNNASITPQASQLVEQGAITTKDIAMVTGVPPQFLYENSESKYVNTVEQAGLDVVRFTFRPWIEHAEAQLTLKLLTRAERAEGLRINIDPDALLRGDAKSQTDIAVAKVKAGIWSVNQALRWLGEPTSTDPEADKLKMSGDTATREKSNSE